MTDIEDILRDACRFECCPYCGNEEMDSGHYCEKCKERFVQTLEVPKWWIDKMAKKYGVVL